MKTKLPKDLENKISQTEIITKRDELLLKEYRSKGINRRTAEGFMEHLAFKELHGHVDDKYLLDSFKRVSTIRERQKVLKKLKENKDPKWDLYADFLRERVNVKKIKQPIKRFWEEKMVDMVGDVITGRFDQVGLALFKGKNKAIPLWFGSRQFKCYRGSKKATRWGIYFPAWALIDYHEALGRLIDRKKRTLNKLKLAAMKELFGEEHEA